MDLLAALSEFFSTLDDWAIALVGTPWVFLVLFLFSLLDAFFPVVPAESFVIAVAAVASAGTEVNLALVVLVAAAGAFVGDQIAFSIGRLIPLERIPFLHRGGIGKMVVRVRETIHHRAAPLLIGARFVPGGRVAVNVSAGAVDFSRIRFMKIDVVAVVLWASYGVFLGMAAGTYLEEHPVIAAFVGSTLGVLMGFVVDWGMRWVDSRQSSRRRRQAHRPADDESPSESSDLP